MFCSHCGKELPSQSNYCPFCGKENSAVKSKVTLDSEKTPEKSESQLPILSNQGQFPMLNITLGVMLGIAILVCGSILLGLGFSTLETTRWTRGIDQLFPYLCIIGGCGAIMSSVVLIFAVWFMSKSFIALYPDEVIGVTFSPTPTKTALGFAYEAPRQFVIPYSDIIRIEISGKCILLVTLTGTYRCRAQGMEEEFYRELTKRISNCRCSARSNG